MQETRRGELASGVALGLSITAVLSVGLLIAFLLFRQPVKIKADLQAPIWPPELPPLPAFEATPAVLEGRLAVLDAPKHLPTNAVRTMTLPALATNTVAYRLATATRTAASMVTVRVVAPQGGLGIFAFTANELADGVALSGDTMIIPTGQYQKIRLQPGQSLYGKGQIAGVMISLVQDQEG